jgi:alkylation response protein AidB-like acyl-CoA dehydrogenase
MRGSFVEAESRYHPNADQVALASTMHESLTALLPLSRLHASYVEDAQTWSSLEEIGMFGIGVSEEHGGSGLGAAEEALIVVGLGRRLAAPAVLATIGATHARTAQGELDLQGRKVASAYRRGERIIIVDDPQAQLVLVREQGGAALYELANTQPAAIDERLWLAHLRTVANLGEPIARFTDSQLLRLRLLDAAALSGIAEATLDMAVAYAGMREQFGRPIGTFQAVKHHCANMAIAARCARDQTSFAAVAIDEARDDAALQVESALFVAGSAALENAGKNIQIHGGFGFSDEADPHLYLKRAQLQIAIAGGLEAANSRLANTNLGG